MPDESTAIPRTPQTEIVGTTACARWRVNRVETRHPSLFHPGEPAVGNGQDVARLHVGTAGADLGRGFQDGQGLMVRSRSGLFAGGQRRVGNGPEAGGRLPFTEVATALVLRGMCRRAVRQATAVASFRCTRNWIGCLLQDFPHQVRGCPQQAGY